MTRKSFMWIKAMGLPLSHAHDATITTERYKAMKLVIMGEPVAAGRPRFSNRGGFVKAYDPKKSREYKALIKEQALQQLSKDYQSFDCPITVDINVYRSIQKSISKKEYDRRLSNEVRPTVKPDTDNYIKIILDGLNGLVWLDDNQITDIAAHKYYSDEPRVEVVANELSKDDRESKNIL